MASFRPRYTIILFLARATLSPLVKYILNLKRKIINMKPIGNTLQFFCVNEKSRFKKKFLASFIFKFYKHFVSEIIHELIRYEWKYKVHSLLSGNIFQLELLNVTTKINLEIKDFIKSSLDLPSEMDWKPGSNIYWSWTHISNFSKLCSVIWKISIVTFAK